MLNNIYSEARLKQNVNSMYNRVCKRIIDFVLACLLFILCLPLIVIVSAAIVLTDGFPVIYRGLRVGLGGREFVMYKFRSMIKDADKIGSVITAYHDPRVTKTGAFLRKMKLDEIPQLVNIIKGDMSFVGPRPETKEYACKFSGLEEYILQVRPGITDYSSLKFINIEEVVGNNDAEEVFKNEILRRKNLFRMKYVVDMSFITDCRIFVGTIYRLMMRLTKGEVCATNE